MGSGVDPDTILQLDQLGAISDHTCGHRVAQLVLQRVGEVTWNEVDELSGDDRGGGFGHSGR